MPNLILSTCGTSLLTQGASSEIRALINSHANSQESELDASTKERLNNHISDVRDKLFSATLQELTRLSAELHAIIRFYEFQLQRAQDDFHFLLTTDTYLGARTGHLIKEWLSQYVSSQPQILNQSNLQTRSLTLFQWAMADLVKWIDQNIEGFKTHNYHIVFNLTGGFKSVQGFLQTLAMFYADETLYVFETGKELFRLPRIPVKIVAQEVIESNFDFFRKLDLGIPTIIPEKIPEVMLLKLEQEYNLSDYGQVIFQQTKRMLYEQKAWPSPFEKLKFGSHFLKSVEGLARDRIRMVNERIDDLTKYFLSSHNPPRLDFKELKGNPKPPSTHEMDAWADRDAKRIYGHFENDIFVLDCLDKALH